MPVETCDSWMLDVRIDARRWDDGDPFLTERQFAWDGGKDREKLKRAIDLIWSSSLRPCTNSITFDMNGIGMKLISLHSIDRDRLRQELGRIRVELCCIYVRQTEPDPFSKVLAGP